MQLAMYLFSRVLYGSLKKSHAANLVTVSSWKPHHDVCLSSWSTRLKHPWDSANPLGFTSCTSSKTQFTSDLVRERKELKKETRAWRRAWAWAWIKNDALTGHGVEEVRRKNKVFMQMEWKVAGWLALRCWKGKMTQYSTKQPQATCATAWWSCSSKK